MISVFFLASNILVAQNSDSTSNIPPKAKLKTINYYYYVKSNNERNSEYDVKINEYKNYSIVGYVFKKEFVIGQKLSFYSNQESSVEFLNGNYYCSEDGNAYINGIWKYRKRDNRYNNSFIIKGTFRINNNINRIGINTENSEKNKLEIFLDKIESYQENYDEGKHLIINKKSDNLYSIKFGDLSFDTSIPNLKKDILDNNVNINKYVEEANQVKIEYENGDVFIGKAKREYNSSFDKYISKAIEGEYRYSSGEIFVGNLETYYHGWPTKGTMTFNDGSIEVGYWLNKYKYDEEEMSKGKTPTEKHDIAIRSNKDELQKQEEKKLIKEHEQQKRLQEEKALKNKLINKYGNYWGNLIFKKEYTPGMTKEMVLEFSNENYYKISKVIRNGSSIEIWEFDKEKMENETIKENGKEGVVSLLALSYFEGSGIGNIESRFPTLVFTNGKLTDVYQK